MSKHPPNPLRREQLLASFGVVEAEKDVELHFTSDTLFFIIHIKKSLFLLNKMCSTPCSKGVKIRF